MRLHFIIFIDMEQALFESITGHFIDGTAVDAEPKKKRVIHSIMDHLNRLFNARSGSIPHLKDYGLPDISDIYRKIPSGIEELKDAIKRTIEQYEPRLKGPRVVYQENNLKESRLVFIVSGEVERGEMVRFQTTFTQTGHSTISPWKKPQ